MLSNRLGPTKITFRSPDCIAETSDIKCQRKMDQKIKLQNVQNCHKINRILQQNDSDDEMNADLTISENDKTAV